MSEETSINEEPLEDRTDMDETAPNYAAVAEDDLRAILAKRDAEIAELKQLMVGKDEEIQRLYELLGDRDKGTSKNDISVESSTETSPPNKKKRTETATLNALANAPLMLLKPRQSKQQTWEYRFQELQQFKLKTGHCNVTFKDDSSLHHWVRKMRWLKTQMDRGKNSEGLTPVRKELLDSIGFVWFVGHQSKDDLWDANFQKLVDYKAVHGHSNVPSNVPKLGKWVMNQRARKRMLEKKGEGKCKGLTWARVAKLEAIGFEWDAPRSRSARHALIAQAQPGPQQAPQATEDISQPVVATGAVAVAAAAAAAAAVTNTVSI